MGIRTNSAAEQCVRSSRSNAERRHGWSLSGTLVVCSSRAWDPRSAAIAEGQRSDAFFPARARNISTKRKRVGLGRVLRTHSLALCACICEIKILHSVGRGGKDFRILTHDTHEPEMVDCAAGASRCRIANSCPTLPRVRSRTPAMNALSIKLFSVCLSALACLVWLTQPSGGAGQSPAQPSECAGQRGG